MVFVLFRKRSISTTWLKEKGWLKFEGEASQDLKAIHPSSRAYSLLPGRIYFFNKDESEQKELEKEVISSLLELRDSSSGLNMIRKVWRREEIYQGSYRTE